MKNLEVAESAWDNDRLGYQEIGEAFTNLIRSIETEKVISIEAGFGRGKTFFRKAWAKQLKSAGEVVVEVDVQQSDHSGDPVITLLGALVDALPKDEEGTGQKALESAKKVGAIGVRALSRAVLKSGAEEVFQAITENAIDKLEDFDALDGVIQGMGNEMSKVAGQLIASQMAAERVRKKELPEQLQSLRAALVDKANTTRIVVIIDELDRCHPDYAISFLEATKAVFDQAGFVFCLMVNADYLENLARHRFGVAKEDEKYLDKFVDIRLKLDPKPETFAEAVHDLACNLPLKIPFSDNKAFSVESAARLASDLAVECGFSMRKTKRILLKVEVALRCYSDRPLDTPLLVFMAFHDESPDKINQDHLPRSGLTPEVAEAAMAQKERSDPSSNREQRREDARWNAEVEKMAPELLGLLDHPHFNPDNIDYKPWAWMYKVLAPSYVPSHRSVLNSVASVLVPENPNEP